MTALHYLQQHRIERKTMRIIFLHGLESSSKGTKGSFLKGIYPNIIVPDFEGSLQHRLQKVEKICFNWNDLILIGSSFGGLMATCFAMKFPEKVQKLILLAPALNFPEFTPPQTRISLPVEIFIGTHDTVTPSNLVVPLALKTFVDPTIHLENDDHMLHRIYATLDWPQLTSIVATK